MYQKSQRNGRPRIWYASCRCRRYGACCILASRKRHKLVKMDKDSRSSFVLMIGFGTLIVLIGVLGFQAVQRAESIYQEMQVAQNSYLRTEEFRRGFVADMYLSDILVRDYLLDPSPDNAPARRQDVQA